MRRVEVRRDGVTLSCLAGGDAGGDTGRGSVVLLHGLAGSARELWPTAEALLARYHVVAVDQRGHGHSTRRPADLSRQAYVEDVVAVIGALFPGGPVTVVGQSMGAHTALLLAAWHPELVSRLVMVEGGVGGVDGVDGDGGYATGLGDWFSSWPVPFPDVDTAAAFLGGTPTAWAWARELQERDGGWWPRFDPDILAEAIRPVAQVAEWEQWRRVVAPTLLVRGEHGTIAEDEVRRMLSLRPEVEHVVVPDAGHDVHLDQPGAWVAILREYLDRQWS